MRLTDSVVEERLISLESLVTNLQSRIARLELEKAQAVVSMEETPVLATEAHAIQAEYVIGAKLVPRFGALLIVLAIAFVAILESSKSATIDRGLLLAAETVFCLAFIAIGEWKHSELEGFGITLTAIGACGLYMTAAGGHFAYQTLSGAAMAGGFALLTLLCHFFAVWRETRLFFFIGALGGVAGVLFPLSQHDYGTATVVYTAVTLSGAAACAMRKWLQLAIIGWLFGFLVLVPIIDSDFSRIAIVVSLYVTSLACIGAYAHSYTPRSLDTYGLEAPIALFATALIGILIQGGTTALAHLTVFCLLGVVVGATISRSNIAGRSLLIGSIATFAILGPLCPPIGAATVTYSLLIAAAIWVARTRYRVLAVPFGLAMLSMAVGTYTFCVLRGIWTQGQVAMLVGLSVALGLMLLTLKASGHGWVGFAIGGGWALLSRWSVVAFPPSEGFSSLGAFSVLYSLMLLVLGFRLCSPAIRMWSFGVMFGSVLLVLFGDQTTSLEYRLLALVAIGVMMLVGGYRYVHDTREPLAADG